VTRKAQPVRIIQRATRDRPHAWEKFGRPSQGRSTGRTKFSQLLIVVVLNETRVLQHRIGVGLIELELAQSLVRGLTHNKMLSGCDNIAETAL
jgi:hypothetical protein